MNYLKLHSVPASKIFIRNTLKIYISEPFQQEFHSSTSKFDESTSKEKAPEDIRVLDVLDDLKEPELTEEEILQKRFKSRLPERIHKMFIQKQSLPLENKSDFQMYRLRSQWAKFGSQTNINPGICWPTRKQIMETIDYDKTFEPSLQERLRRVNEERMAKEKEKQEYEAEVDQNMANLDKWIAEYHGRIAKQEEKVRQLRDKREKLVEEISEYLGYEIDPKDPRFKEAVEQRDKAKKKEMKAQKQKESYDKMLEKLKKIAQQKT
ncbi:large ribosomal subunit protein mL64 [Parasteatoda tepidariorum]|uniref:large ribosomal subunit protein mL64 n=1 Tax=Parasteatoda tepidariorum TaxID=114398 RepID=UPI00077FA09C|nr:growth arrest and DNA damage-inducible proteins-interacting protein 1 [Parasteatoda tepidariorum]